MSTGTATQHQVHKEVRLAMLERYGSLAHPLVELTRRVIHPIRYGLIPESVHGQCPSTWVPRHRYTTAYLNTAHGPASRPRSLPLWRIRAHHLAEDKRGYLWYTARAMATSMNGGRPIRFCLMCVDIDAHAGESDVAEVHFLLRDKIPFLAGAYSEPSTNGAGLHVYLPVAFGQYASNKDIRDGFRALELHIASVTNGRVTEVKGAPAEIIRSGANGLVGNRGTLGKLPRCATYEEAAELVRICAHPLPCAQLPSLREVEVAKPSGGKKPSQRKYPAPTTSHTTPLADKGDNVSPLCGEGTGDAWRRSWDAACELARTLNRAPSAQEAQDYYEVKGLHTGPDDGDRANRFARICDIIASDFKPITRRRSTPLDAYLSTVRQRISASHIRHAYRHRPLAHETIAEYLAIATDAVLRKRSPGKKYMIEAFRALHREGKVARLIDNKSRAAIVRLLADADLLVQVRKPSKKSGRAAGFGLGAAHPLAQ